MKTLFLLLLTIYLVFSDSLVSGQSEEYAIESFQDEYTELTEYESISLIFDGSPLWEYEFQLDFSFPFYGAFYDKMIYTQDAWGMVTDDEDLGLYIMNFAGGYAYEFAHDTINIESDIRFSNVFINNMQAFVIQFTKVGFFADPFEDSLNTYMNFQLWFFENGIAEVHFGEMHMDGTPIYSPGNGFYCYTTSGGVDTNDVCGPNIGISNPFDEEDGIAVSGPYNNFEVVGDIYANLTVLPPQGWIIRFKPTSVGIFEPDYQLNEISIHPNPATSCISIAEPGGKVTIYDSSGRIAYNELESESDVDVSTLQSGLYFVRIESSQKSSIGKFLKI